LIKKKIIKLERSQKESVVEIFINAFYSDPLFKYILSPSSNVYSDCLRELFGFSCEVRYLLDWPILGYQDESGKIAGAAGISLPGDTPWPQTLSDVYQHFKDFIGPEAAERFERMAALAEPLSPPQPYHELGVIGVLTETQGKGYGGQLVQAVNRLAEKHPESTGVYLWTQNPQNVAFYQRHGYQIRGKRVFSEENELYLWGMFRVNP